MNHSFLYQNNQNYRDQKLYSKLNEVGIQFEWIPLAKIKLYQKL